MDFSNFIDPKAFTSYDDYRKALTLHEEFKKRSEKVDDVMRKSKTEEEMHREMEKLGFTWVDEDTCGRTWCKEREECVSIALEFRQDECNEHCFGGLLAPEDLLIREPVEDAHGLLVVGCDTLHPSWFDPCSREHAALWWFLDSADAIIFEIDRVVSFENFLKQHPDCRGFLEHAYFCALHVARGRPWPDAAEGERVIRSFLEGTRLLPNDLARHLLERFRGCMGE